MIMKIASIKSFSMTVLWLAMAAVMAGCQPLRDYVQPEDPPGSAESDLSAAGPNNYRNAEPVAAWWHQFDDPQLAALIEQSLETNLDVRIALANLSRARAILRESSFDRFPTVTADASYTRERLSREGAVGELSDRRFNNYEAGFDAFGSLICSAVSASA